MALFFFLYTMYKTMSSVHAALSQVAPHKRYVANASAHMYNASGAGAVSVAQYAVLRDMGKTVYLNDANSNVLRKVQVLPVITAATNSGVTGYIYISGVVPSDQNIVALN